MVSITRVLPAVLLCVALLVPTPVQARSIGEWINVVCNFFRTLFYYFIPIRRRQVEAIDATLHDLTDILKEIMPERSTLRSYETSKHSSYVCLAEGYAGNFRTVRKVGKVKCIWESDNSVNVDIPYTIEEFKAGYGVVYLKMLKTSSKRGTLDMNFGKNRLVVGMQIPNVVDMIGKLTKGDSCMVYITKVDVTYLGGVKLDLLSVGGRKSMFIGKLFTFIFSHKNGILKQLVRERFLGNMYLKLSKASSTVCIHPPLLMEMKQLGLLEKRVYSSQFDKLCGKDRELSATDNNKERSWTKIFKKRRKPIPQNPTDAETVTGVVTDPSKNEKKKPGTEK